MEFLGGDRWRQCVQAGVAFGVSTCCVRDGVLEAASPCDKQWHPEFDTWGFDSDFVPSDSQSRSRLTWDEFTTEIDEVGPFLFGWVESPPITHMLVAIGYNEVYGDKKVIYLDPLAALKPDPIMESFSLYDGSSGVYPHKFDYISIRQR